MSYLPDVVPDVFFCLIIQFEIPLGSGLKATHIIIRLEGFQTPHEGMQSNASDQRNDGFFAITDLKIRGRAETHGHSKRCKYERLPNMTNEYGRFRVRSFLRVFTFRADDGYVFN